MAESIGSSHRKPNLALPVLLILFTICSTYLYQNMRLNSKIQTLENEIQSLESSTVEIQKTLPSLRQVSEQILNSVIPHLVPRENTEEWCANLVNYPYLQANFKRAHRIRKPKIPIQMELPRVLRDAGKHLHPAIIPFQVEVKVDGTLSQMVYFLSEINRQCLKMVVSKIDLHSADNTDLFTGSLTLTFPQIQFPEDIEEISRFTAKSLPKTNGFADLN
jgi:hypothetical protein